MKTRFLLFIVIMSMTLTFAQTDSTKVDNFQKTDKVLSEVVKKALIVAEKTGEFVIEQTPLLLQEFYNWHITRNIIKITTSILFIIILFLIRKRLIKYSEKNNIDWSDAEFMFPIMFIYTGLLIFIILLFNCIYNLIYILIAPKLYLIEYFIK